MEKKAATTGPGRAIVIDNGKAKNESELVVESQTFGERIDAAGRSPNDPATLRTVGKMVITDTFGSMIDKSGFVVKLRPSATVYPDIISSGHFCGHVCALRVSTKRIFDAVGGGDGVEEKADRIRRVLEWACPTYNYSTPDLGVSVSALTGVSHLDGQDPDVFIDDNAAALTPADASVWTPALDESGFAGLYKLNESGGSSDLDGLLVVCCRTTPAAQSLRDKIFNDTAKRNASEPLSYAALASSPLYLRIADAAERNTTRMLFTAASALGWTVGTAVQDSAAVIRHSSSDVISSITVGDASAVTAVPGVCSVIQAITDSLIEKPYRVIPDIANFMDVFVLHHDGDKNSSLKINSVNYYNSTYPASVTLGNGDFIVAKNEATVLDGITLQNRADAHNYGGIAYFDGRVTSRAASLPIRQLTGPTYDVVCAVGGAGLVRVPLPGETLATK